MGDLYYMLHEKEHQDRASIVRIIGNAVKDGNESYSAEELGTKIVEALVEGNYEIIWKGPK